MRIDKGVSFLLLFGFGPSVLPGTGQTADKYPENPTPQVKVPSRTARLGRLPMEWIIGPYIPVQGNSKLYRMPGEGRSMFGRRSLPPDLAWRGRFQPDLTRHVVSLPIGAAALLATADVTRRGTQSSQFRAAYGLEGMLFSGMSLGTISAVASGSGLARVTLYRETL
jgi:hypothetical protein